MHKTIILEALSRARSPSMFNNCTILLIIVLSLVQLLLLPKLVLITKNCLLQSMHNDTSLHYCVPKCLTTRLVMINTRSCRFGESRNLVKHSPVTICKSKFITWETFKNDVLENLRVGFVLLVLCVSVGFVGLLGCWFVVGSNLICQKRSTHHQN